MSFITKFRQTIELAYPQLRKLSPEKVSIRPAPNRWSIKEIMGHLIDSANNNHRRFTKAQWQDNLIFQGYAQDRWVTAQQYQTSDWLLLVDLWHSYNLHICHIMENTPKEKLEKSTTDHNFHQIAMVKIPEGESTTLAYFMKDYIFHLVHHLKQIGIEVE